MRILLLSLLLARPASAAGPEVIRLDSAAPLIAIKVMVRAGSAHDPAGREGAAHLAGRLLIQGGFGDPTDPVTKEKLVTITRPWGGGAHPSVRVSKEATTFSMTVPADKLAAYIDKVLRPMFTQPLFISEEIDRLRGETRESLRSLRLEQIEMVGLVALDNLVFERGPYGHPARGTEAGLERVDQETLRRFYATYYRPGNMTVGVGSSDPAVAKALQRALKDSGRIKAKRFKSPERWSRKKGERMTIVALPSAISTGLHGAFEIDVRRGHKDFWPLYVANVGFGAHRDMSGQLFNLLRERRGYNYGNYSYIEHFEERPWHLFPPTNTPRKKQYFSIWIRPVAHEYAHHILKAFSWEFERFAREGLSPEACAKAKKKARVLYLSLAETAERLVATRLDDAFYKMPGGFLENYLESVRGVTCEQINDAVRRHLGGKELRYLIVTDDDKAGALVDAVVADRAAWGKMPKDYQIDVADKDGKKMYEVPSEKLDILRRDAVWAHHRLRLSRKDIRVIKAEDLFQNDSLAR